LYLCDTKNHAIREINLAKKEVLTVIGTGEKGFDREGNKDPEMQKLSSPWDIVAINRDTLIIAMAGVHQIWALNLKTVSIKSLIKQYIEQVLQLQRDRQGREPQSQGRHQAERVGLTIGTQSWNNIKHQSGTIHRCNQSIN
jgi:hypothetical protein